MMIIKNITHPKVLHYELNEPLSVSLLPTFSMCLMLVAGFIGMWNNKDKTSANQIVAAVVMCLAILIQFIIIGFFVKSFIKNHIKSKHQHMYGSYFVPIVGLITSCTVSHNVIALPNEFFQAIWYFGYITFLITLPIVTYSMLFKEKKVSDAQFPTVAIWFAPANLTCAGFLRTFLLSPQTYYPKAYLNIIFILTTMMGFVTTLILYLYVTRIFVLRKRSQTKNFAPILCSLSFPCAIGATSMVWAAKYLASQNPLVINKIIPIWKIEGNDLISSSAWFFGVVGIIFAIVTTIIIGYLLFNMIKFGIKILFTKQKDDQHHEIYLKK